MVHGFRDLSPPQESVAGDLLGSPRVWHFSQVVSLKHSPDPGRRRSWHDQRDGQDRTAGVWVSLRDRSTVALATAHRMPLNTRAAFLQWLSPSLSGFHFHPR